MSWTAQAVAALRKIITMEKRVVTLAEDIQDLGQIVTEMDRRLVRLETKVEMMERFGERRGGRRIPC